MNLILCHADDRAALWLHRALAAAGVADLQLVAVEQLAFSRRIVHRMDSASDTGEIRLADGRTIRPEAVAGLVNRVRFIPGDHLARAVERDRIYALDELHAFFLAWLDSIPGLVLNRARPEAIGGDHVPALLAAREAAAVGLPVAAHHGSSREPDALESTGSDARAIVLGHRVFGPILPRALQDGCRRLGVALGLGLMQVNFVRDPDGGLRFSGASGAVDFPSGGQALVGALADTLATGRLQ